MALYCRRCVTAGMTTDEAGKGLRVERGGQYRRVAGIRRRTVNVTCRAGHEWWSVADDALRRSTNRDSRAKIKMDAAEMDRIQRPEVQE